MPVPLRDRRLDVLCLGEALIDFLPSRRGALADVPSFTRHPGGAPANVAIGVARLGGRSALVGTVGSDPFGRYLHAAFTQEGVDVASLGFVEGVRTGLAFISLDDAGQPRFFAAGGAAELETTVEAIARVPFADARIFHHGSGLSRGPRSREAAFDAVRRAREAGCLVSLDPNLRLHHWADTAPLAADLERLIAAADLVKLSSDEIGFATGAAEPAEAARRLCTRGPRLAIVTVGSHGCVYARLTPHGLQEGALPARPARVVDTTGAGDGFEAALLEGLARRIVAGEDVFTLDRQRLEESLRRALEVGTRVCEQVGAVAGLPRLADLESAAQ